jgi:hypothetical protein
MRLVPANRATTCPGPLFGKVLGFGAGVGAGLGVAVELGGLVGVGLVELLDPELLEEFGDASCAGDASCVVDGDLVSLEL